MPAPRTELNKKEKTEESKVNLYDLVMGDEELKALKGTETDPQVIAGKLAGKLNGKLLTASINFQDDLNNAKLQFFLDRENVTELLSNYLIGCEIDLDSIEDIESFAREVEGVYDDFLARWGKQQKFAIV